MERPGDYEEREVPPAQTETEAGETVGEEPAREDGHLGPDPPGGVSGAEDRPAI